MFSYRIRTCGIYCSNICS
ncbi:UNVERIFIED_CONTAM: hypothetical protein GTU68_066804 [Idotea baltica]|nr:hypothetical protein [Idotea baltica]